MTKKYVLIILLMAMTASVFAQDDDFFENFGENKNIYDLTLEELFNKNVSSVSKKSESLFEAPLSASVVTKDEILNAGCNSILEALRLMPGLIVRQQTNGYYEVFVRGGENMIPGSFLPYFANANTLVMIDGRPVYNYLQGGTFWETLPVDLNDVERIELVRGAMSALYGPNAVSGVINIITRKPKNYTVYNVSNVQYGSNNSLIANTSLGYKFNQKFDVVFSGNMQKRDRFTDQYYIYSQNAYSSDINQMNAVFGAPIDEDVLTARFPNQQQAMDNYAVNAFINFNPADYVKFSASLGMQDSWVQKAYSENTATPFSTATSQTNYLDFRTNIHNLSGQVSLMEGKQSPALETFGLTYDMSTLDAFFEYDFVFGNLSENGISSHKFGEVNTPFLPKNHSISLRPGFNYRKAVYDDTEYWENGEGFINDRGTLNTTAFSLKLDYDIVKKFRFTAALRNDKHNYPDKNFLSFQTSVKYHLNPKHIIRATYSRSYRGIYILDTYSNFTIDAGFPTSHYMFSDVLYPSTIASLMGMGMTEEQAAYAASNIWNSANYEFKFFGNTSGDELINKYNGKYAGIDNQYVERIDDVIGFNDLDLLKNDMFEIGYRARIADNLAFDLEAYHSRISDFVYPIIMEEAYQYDTVGVFQLMPGVNLPVIDFTLSVDNYNDNFNQQFVQSGLSFSVNYFVKNFQFKPFINLQNSEIKNYTGYPEDIEEYDSLYTVDHQGTPSVSGGAYINYKLDKFNFNLSPYFFSSSELVHDFAALRPPLADGNLPEGTAFDRIDGKFILNATVNYQLTNNLKLFASGKNILGSDQREYFYTDPIPSRYFIGINFEY